MVFRVKLLTIREKMNLLISLHVFRGATSRFERSMVTLVAPHVKVDQIVKRILRCQFKPMPMDNICHSKSRKTTGEQRFICQN